MYIPPYFAKTDQAELCAAIERYSFATLVSQSAAAGLVASHLPLLLDREPQPDRPLEQRTLLGHLARANLQWQQAAGQEVLAIFSGPHAYISPQWYAASGTVPTWNYVAVHAYGVLELMKDDAEVEALLTRMIDYYESSQAQPWRLVEPRVFIEKMLKQIVGFRIRISRLEGKWKLSQNRPLEQHERVVAALSDQADDSAQKIARLMRRERDGTTAE